MDIIVCMKLVPDLKHIRIKRETREPVLDGLPQVWGDMDKNALEEGIRLREKHGGKVTVLTAGWGKLKEAVVEALAMGADEGVIVADPSFQAADTAAVARVLVSAVMKIASFDLILTAEGSTDGYSGQVGPRMAELLGLPQVTYVREMTAEGGRLRAVRSMEESFEVVECSLPALVTVTQEINTPRLPPLTAILRASRKPQRTFSLDDLGPGMASLSPVVERLTNLAPVQDRKNVLLEGSEAVETLVAALEREGVLGG
jgi:electron transfer flavoprotein beta subunit